MTTGELAALVGARCDGPTDRVLTGVASLSHATDRDLSFCRGGPFARHLASTLAGAVFVREEAVPAGTIALRVDDPRYAFARAATAIVPAWWPEPAVHPTAAISPSAKIGRCKIEAFVVIEDDAEVGDGCWLQAHAYVGRGTKIGAGSRLMPGAVVMEDCELGERVWLGPGAVVGADGFGHAPGPEGVVRVPQVGVAVLEDDVGIGANACVDRAALDETRVGRGTRLDNLVQVAHGVQIGAECLLAAFAGVAGGAKLGNRVIMAGRTAVTDGVEVGDGAVFAGMAAAHATVPPGARIGGSPARSYRRWLREVAALKRLPDLLRRFDRLERSLRTAEEGADGG